MNRPEIQIRPSISIIRNVMAVIDDLGNYLCHPENIERHIHHIRVDIKKLRAWIRLIQDPADRQEWREIDHCLRDMAKRLSDRRDQEVIPNTLEWLKKKENRKDVAVSIQKVHTIIRAGGNRQFADPGAIIAADKRILDTLRRETLSATGYKTVRQGLRNTYRRARKLGARACSETGTIEDLHKFRRWVKYLYYQLEFIGDGYTGENGDFHGQLDKLGKRLGRIHDLVLIKKHIPDPARGGESGKHAHETGKAADRNMRKLVRRVQKTFSTIFVLKPGRFVSGLRPF